MHNTTYYNTLFNFVTIQQVDTIILKDSYALLPLESSDSHIRIDKLFSKENEFFPFAHYTTSHNGRKVHIGFYDDGSIAPFPDNVGLVTEQIRNNAIAARSQLDHLMKSFSDYIQQLENKYLSIEVKLSNAKTQEERSRNYHTCIDILKEKCHLLQEEDPRLNFLISQEKYFMVEPPLPIKPPVEEVCEQESLSTQDMEDQVVTVKQEKKQVNYEDECKELISKLNKSKTNLLKFNMLVKNIEVLVGLHTITPCLSARTLNRAQEAIKQKASDAEIIVDRIRRNDFANASCYALHTSPLQVIRELCINEALTAKQKLSFLKHMCAKNPIYHYTIAYGAFASDKNNFSPIIFYFYASTPPSKDKDKLIDFIAKRIRINTLLYDGNYLPYLSALLLYSYAEADDALTIPDALRIIGITLSIPQYKHIETTELTYIKYTESEKSLVRSTREQSKQAVHTEYLYSTFPREEKHLSTKIFDLIIARANLTELILLLQNIAFCNNRINIRVITGCYLKNNVGLAVGNDKAQLFQVAEKFRSASLFSELKSSPLTLYGIEKTSEKINRLLFSDSNTATQLRLLDTAYNRITALDRAPSSLFSYATFYAKAKSLCAQIALTITPHKSTESVNWAELMQKSLLEIIFKAKHEDLMIMLENTIMKFVSVRQPDPSFTQPHLKRLNLLLTSSLRNKKPKEAFKILCKVIEFLPKVSTNNDEVRVLSEVAEQSGMVVTFTK